MSQSYYITTIQLDNDNNEKKLDSLSNNNMLSKSVKDHLRKVYIGLVLCMLAEAGGASLHNFTELLNFGLLSSCLFGFFLMALLEGTPHDSSNHITSIIRLGYLLGHAFFHGMFMRQLFAFVIPFSNTYLIQHGPMTDKVSYWCFYLALVLGNSVIYFCLTCYPGFYSCK